MKHLLFSYKLFIGCPLSSLAFVMRLKISIQIWFCSDDLNLMQTTMSPLPMDYKEMMIFYVENTSS